MLHRVLHSDVLGFWTSLCNKAQLIRVVFITKQHLVDHLPIAINQSQRKFFMLLDHIVLFVDDLDDAIQTFSSFGFTVTPGGTNGPTHNALIAFENETYIELIALRTIRVRRLFKLLRSVGLIGLRRAAKRDLNTRLFSWFSGPQGFRDICFRAPSLEAVKQDCQKKGYPLTPIIAFNRHRPDGITVSWYLAGTLDEEQPFFIEDKTPLHYRIPDGRARIHTNGALGITELTTRTVLNFSAENVTTVTGPANHRGKFSIGIKTSSSPQQLEIPSVYEANIRLIS